MSRWGWSSLLIASQTIALDPGCRAYSLVSGSYDHEQDFLVSKSANAGRQMGPLFQLRLNITFRTMFPEEAL